MTGSILGIKRSNTILLQKKRYNDEEGRRRLLWRSKEGGRGEEYIHCLKNI